MDNSTTVQYANLLHSLTAQARNCVRDVDPTNDLTFLRVRSKKNEVMVAPGVLLNYSYISQLRLCLAAVMVEDSGALTIQIIMSYLLIDRVNLHRQAVHPNR